MDIKKVEHTWVDEKEFREILKPTNEVALDIRSALDRHNIPTYAVILVNEHGQARFMRQGRPDLIIKLCNTMADAELLEMEKQGYA